MGTRGRTSIRIVRGDRGESGPLPRTAPAPRQSIHEQVERAIRWDNFGPVRSNAREPATPIRLGGQLRLALLGSGESLLRNWMELYDEDESAVYNVKFPGDPDHYYSLGMGPDSQLTASGSYGGVTLLLALGSKPKDDRISAQTHGSGHWELTDEVDLFRDFIHCLAEDPESINELDMSDVF